MREVDEKAAKERAEARRIQKEKTESGRAAVNLQFSGGKFPLAKVQSQRRSDGTTTTSKISRRGS